MVFKHFHELIEGLVTSSLYFFILGHLPLSKHNFIGHIIQSSVLEPVDLVLSQEVASSDVELDSTFDFWFIIDIVDNLHFFALKHLIQLSHHLLSLSRAFPLSTHPLLSLVPIEFGPGLLSILTNLQVFAELLSHMLHEVRTRADQVTFRSVDERTYFDAESVRSSDSIHEFLPFGLIFNHVLHLHVWSIVLEELTKDLAV